MAHSVFDELHARLGRVPTTEEYIDWKRQIAQENGYSFDSYDTDTAFYEALSGQAQPMDSYSRRNLENQLNRRESKKGYGSGW